MDETKEKIREELIREICGKIAIKLAENFHKIEINNVLSELGTSIVSETDTSTGDKKTEWAYGFKILFSKASKI